MLALVDREGSQWVSHTDANIYVPPNPDRYQDSKDGSTETEKRRRDKGRDGSAGRRTGSARRGRSSGGGSRGAAESRSVGGGRAEARASGDDGEETCRSDGRKCSERWK